MRNPLYNMAIVVMLLTATAGRSQAQSNGTLTQRVVYHIEGITAEERDAIAQELAGTGEGRVAFACIPAGILVIEHEAAHQEQAASTVRRNIGTKPATLDARGQVDLEAACMNERNR